MLIIITPVLNFRKLLIGRIKLFLMTLEVGYQIIHEHFDDRPEQLPPSPLTFHKIFLVLSETNKKTSRMIELFNRGFRQLRKSGKYKKLFKELQKGEYIIKNCIVEHI